MPPTVTADNNGLLNFGETVCDTQPTIPFVLPPSRSGMVADTLVTAEVGTAMQADTGIRSESR